MAIKVMTQVWENGPQDKMERFVLLALADHCNDEGHCYPSLDLLQKKCLLTRQGLCNVIDRLEQKGYIVRQRGGGKGNPTNYWIQLDSLRPQPKSQADNSQVDQSNSQADQGKSQVDTRKSQADQEKESSWLDGNRQGTTKEPSKEPSRKRKRTHAREKSPYQPELEKVLAYAPTLGVSEAMAEEFYDYYDALGWELGEGKPIKRWKPKLKAWKARQHKYTTNGKPTHKQKTNGHSEDDPAQQFGHYYDVAMRALGD